MSSNILAAEIYASTLKSNQFTVVLKDRGLRSHQTDPARYYFCIYFFIRERSFDTGHIQ